MWTLIGLSYYLFAGALLVALGAIAHVLRATVNLYPDRLTDKKWLDMAVSDGYDARDHLFGTEYDEFGFYRLDSRHNLLIAVLSTLAAGWGAMLLSTELAVAFAQSVDVVISWTGELFTRRLAEARWW